MYREKGLADRARSLKVRKAKRSALAPQPSTPSPNPLRGEGDKTGVLALTQQFADQVQESCGIDRFGKVSAESGPYGAAAIVVL